MIIDFHCHVGKDIDGEECSLMDLKKSMERWGIDKACIFPFNNTNEIMVQTSLDLLEKSKDEDWIVPFLRFDPQLVSSDELENLISKGFKGIKLHPSAQKFEISNEEFFWIYELCQEKKLPILFHSSAKYKNIHPAKILKIAKAFPQLKIIIAHFFGDDLRIITKLKKHKNVYTDISINSRTFRINQAIYEFDFKNFLFGSDIPYDSQGVALMKVDESDLRKEDRELVLSGNAKKILGL